MRLLRAGHVGARRLNCGVMRLNRHIVLFLVAAIVAGAWLSFGSEMYVVADGPVRIVRDLESRNVQDPSVVVATLQAGDRVPVIGCRNLKEDQVYLVRTKDQIEGYIAGWPFRLEHKPWTLLSSKVVCY
jgi:hypothetical protein